MPYSNDVEVLKTGLTEYLGAIQDALPFKGVNKNRMLVAIMMDEVLQTAQISQGEPCSLYVLKPFFEGLKLVLEQQQAILAKTPTEENKERIISYQSMLEEIETIINENSNFQKANKKHVKKTKNV